MEWHDEDPFAVEGLLIFLYTARYPQNFIRISKPQSGLGDFDIHLKLFQIADKRFAEGLRMQAADMIAKVLGQCQKSANFRSMMEQLRASDISLPENIGSATATASTSGLQDDFPLDALWSEGTFEHGLMREYIGTSRIDKQKIKHLQKLGKEACVQIDFILELHDHNTKIRSISQELNAAHGILKRIKTGE